jgi:hypothetical protein
MGRRCRRPQEEEEVRLALVAPIAASVFVVNVARADDASGILETRHHRYESAQHFALEFRFAPYKANVDDAPELGGNTPYADAFGSNPRLEVATELDWQVLRIPHVGTLGPGLSVGYTSVSRPAVIKNCPPLPRGATSCTSAEDNNLAIYPFYAVAVLRLDVLMRDLRIPIVPYVKGGVGFAFWRASNTLGTSQADDGVSGKGHTWGTHLAAGLALHMNVFDNAAAVNLDNSVGINHTYAFVEVMDARLTGLGQSHALFVGTTTWVAGLSFEM